MEAGPLHLLNTIVSGWLPAAILFVLCLGSGLALMPARWLLLPHPWPLCIATVLGWHMTTLSLFLTGMFGSLTKPTLIAVSVALLGLSISAVMRGRLSIPLRSLLDLKTWWQLPWSYRNLALLSLCFAGILLTIASTPPSKHDDLWYHLILPQRALIDKSFTWYPTSWLSAMPHIAYSVMLTWLLSFAHSSSTLFVGFLWSLLFICVCYSFISERQSPRKAAIACTITLVAMANVVWWVSASPTIVSILFSTIFLLWVLDRDDAITKNLLSDSDYYSILGLMGAALCTTKLTFVLPVALLMFSRLLRDLRTGAPLFSTMLNGMIAGGTTLLVWSPWLYWTWHASGNPFAVSALSVFPSKVYDRESLEQKLQFVAASNQFFVGPLGNNPGLLPMWGLLGYLAEVIRFKQVNLAHMPAILLGAWVLVRRRQWEVLGAVAISSYVLGIVTTHDLRFHAVPAYGFLMVAFVWWTPIKVPELWRVWTPYIVAVLSLPIVLGAAYYSSLFVPVAAGLTSEQDFLQKHVGLYTVFDWCNVNLPPDSRVLLDVDKPRAFYLKRIALNPEGITSEERIAGEMPVRYMRKHGLSYAITLDPTVYKANTNFTMVKEFKDCIIEGWRSPGAVPERGDAWVFKLD